MDGVPFLGRLMDRAGSWVGVGVGVGSGDEESVVLLC